MKGNLTVNQNGNAYTYDFDNRMTGANTDGNPGDEVTFEYDALGRRARKSDGTTNRVYAYSGQQVVAEYISGSLAASPSEQYVYASYIDEPIFKTGTGGAVYYSRNQQYSITALTDSTGDVVERYSYDAHGRLTIYDASGTIITATSYANPYTYTARRFDSETGLYYFRARYFDPTLGRFISRDPLGFVDGMSLYGGYFVPNDQDPEGTRISEEGGGKLSCHESGFGVKCDRGSSCCLEDCIASGGEAASCNKCCNPKAHCKLTNGPRYHVAGKVPRQEGDKIQHFDLSMEAKFSNNPANGEFCSCCEVRQDIQWNRVFHENHGPPYAAFHAPDNTPDTWHEDRERLDGQPDGTPRYGRRSYRGDIPRDAYVTDAFEKDQANGCRWIGVDMVSGPRHVGFDGGVWSFRLRVIDVCNGNVTVGISAAVIVNWQ